MFNVLITDVVRKPFFSFLSFLIYKIWNLKEETTVLWKQILHPQKQAV